MKTTISKSTFQLKLLFGTLFIFGFIQTIIFSQSFVSVLGGIAIAAFSALALALIVYWIVNRNSSEDNPKLKYKVSWLYSIVALLMFLMFSPISDPNRVESSSISSSPRNPYADNQIHHCTYCGKEFSGPGYVSPMGKCVKQEEDAGMGDIYTCTLKCCKESLQ